MPFPLASAANSCFQVSKPPGELPHCAASALPPRPVSRTNAMTAAGTISLPVTIANSLDAETTLACSLPARKCCRSRGKRGQVPENHDYGMRDFDAVDLDG